MSLTFDKKIGLAIENYDNASIVDLIEPRITSGIASESEKLLFGVSLLMPPLADYEYSGKIFNGLFSGGRFFEAAVWDAYRFALLLPDGSEDFLQLLKRFPNSAIASHMTSLVASAQGNITLALQENRKSRSLRLFPFNVVEALRIDSGLDAEARNALWINACDLFISKSAESDIAIHTIEGALQRHWENLIVGTRITGELWKDYQKAFA